MSISEHETLVRGGALMFFGLGLVILALMVFAQLLVHPPDNSYARWITGLICAALTLTGCSTAGVGLGEMMSVVVGFLYRH